MARAKTFIKECAPFLKRIGTINSGACESCDLWIDITTGKICATACPETWFVWNIADSKQELIKMFYKYCEICENKLVKKHTYGFVDCLVFNGFGEHNVLIHEDKKLNEKLKKELDEINKLWKENVQKKKTESFSLSEIEDNNPFIGYNC